MCVCVCVCVYEFLTTSKVEIFACTSFRGTNFREFYFRDFFEEFFSKSVQREISENKFLQNFLIKLVQMQNKGSFSFFTLIRLRNNFSENQCF